MDERTGVIHDYSRRSGVVHSEILIPDGAAVWLLQRERLWNAAERAEKRKDGVVGAKEILALPHELSRQSRLELARAYAKELVLRHGCAVDFAVHDPDDDGDKRNHHLHVQITSRVAGPDGLGAKLAIQKDTAWGGRRDALNADRELWERLVNEALARANLEVRIDRRTLAAQRAEPRPGVRVPAVAQLPGKHLGPAASAIDRKAKRTRGADVVVSELGKAAANGNAKSGETPKSIFEALGIPRESKRVEKPLISNYLAYRERALAELTRVQTAGQEARRNLREKQRSMRESLESTGTTYRVKRVMGSVLAAEQKAERAGLRAALALEIEQVRPKRFREWARGWSAAQRKAAGGRKRPVSIFEALKRPEKRITASATTQQGRKLTIPGSVDRAKADRWLDRHRKAKSGQLATKSESKSVASAKLKDLDSAARVSVWPEGSRAERYKRKILAEEYQKPELAQRLAALRLGIKWVRTDDPTAVHVRLADGGWVVDHGDSMNASTKGKDEVTLLVELARAKGWTRVGIKGDADFCARAQTAFDAVGIEVEVVNEAPSRKPSRGPR